MMPSRSPRAPLAAGIALVALMAGLAGCTSSDPAGTPMPPPAGASPPAAPATPPQPSAPAPPPPPPDDGPGVREFIVDVTESGFNGQPGLTLRVRVGDQVRIAFRHAEPYADYHPIQFACNGKVANVAPGPDPAVVEFTADQAGTCGFACQNHDCNVHDKLQDGKLEVAA